jgi:integrase
MYYFRGTAAEALAQWLNAKDHLINGEEVSAKDASGGVTVQALINNFLTYKKGLRDQQDPEIAPRTFDRYLATGTMLADMLKRETLVCDLTPQHFERLRARMAKRFRPVALANEIQAVRTIFKYGLDAEILDKPVRFGKSFEKPSAKAIRGERTEGGTAFTPEQIKSVIALARPAMKAMILLGANGALGNTEVAVLTERKFDLPGGWLNDRRAKTGIARRIPLWPETVSAVEASIEKRTKPKDDADTKFIFIGARGESYVGDHKGYRVTAEFSRLLRAAGIVDRSFYDLRRTFQTVAEKSSTDFPAISAIMGHAPKSGDLAAVYRQGGIGDERLRAVADGVRGWLFPA